MRKASAPCEASSWRGLSFHTPWLSSHSLRYARIRLRPRSQHPSSNWHWAKAVRAAAIASSLLRGLPQTSDAGFLYSRKPLIQVALTAGPCLRSRSDNPSEAPLSGRDGRGWRVVAACEGEERVGPVRGIIVPRAVLPHPPGSRPSPWRTPEAAAAQAASLLGEPTTADLVLSVCPP